MLILKFYDAGYLPSCRAVDSSMLHKSHKAFVLQFHPDKQHGSDAEKQMACELVKTYVPMFQELLSMRDSSMDEAGELLALPAPFEVEVESDASASDSAQETSAELAPAGGIGVDRSTPVLEVDAVPAREWGYVPME